MSLVRAGKSLGRKEQNDPSAFLVLGMHRSGTSAVSRTLNLLGAALPGKLIGANEFNEKGHWEPIELVAFNDRLLTAIGSHWSALRAIDMERLDNSYTWAIELETLINANYPGGKDIVIKDPRLCLLAPIYIQVLAKMGYQLRFLIPFRDPAEVTASLKKRDGMNRRYAALLWLRHVLEAERQTRQFDRHIFAYDDFLGDWRSALGPTLSWFFDRSLHDDAPTIAAIEENLVPGLRHHRHEGANDEEHGPMGKWADTAYEMFRRCDGTLDEVEQVALDVLYANLQVAGSLADALKNDPVEKEKDVRLQQMAKAQNLLRSELDAMKERIAADEANDIITTLKTELEDEKMALAYETMLREEGVVSDHKPDGFDALKPLATVVIPVKNGLPEFERVIGALETQKLDEAFEVIIIDSGSSDRSLDVVPKADPRFRIVRIQSSFFGHGKTRNFGAKLARGKYCAFLTHDACPVDDHWLAALLTPMEADNEIAGVFGRHIAYETASPFTHWELETHFGGLGNWPVIKLDDARRYVRDRGLRQVYHFYSDNSSAFRRAIWEKHPYPNVNFAEDQLWAKKIVEAGYKKAFAADSVVYHSHDYTLWERVQRSYDESKALRELLGYELCPNLKHLLGQTWRTSRRDFNLAYKEGWWRTHPLQVLRQPFDNLARQIGYYLGTRDNAVSRRNDVLLSRDRSLKAT